jgi:hypothetical protein
LVDDRANLPDIYVPNSILQPGQGAAQRGTQVLVAGDDLPELLQTRHLRNQPQQAHFG